jgi:hypothetical protein
MSSKNHSQDEISEFFQDPERVRQAIQKGIWAALLKHKQAGNPVCTWKDDKVVWIAPEDIPDDFQSDSAEIINENTEY